MKRVNRNESPEPGKVSGVGASGAGSGAIDDNIPNNHLNGAGAQRHESGEHVVQVQKQPAS